MTAKEKLLLRVPDRSDEQARSRYAESSRTRSQSETLTGEPQRDTVYEEVLTELSGIGGPWLALEDDDSDTARWY